MNENFLYETEIQFIEALPLNFNPNISEIKIKIASAGQANNFIFAKEVLEKAARESLPLTPIVAMWNPYKEDFEAHGKQAVMDEYGEYVYTGSTQPVGVIPEKPEIYWDSDEYLVVTGYLWTDLYEETKVALEGRPQSMELNEARTIMKPTGDGRIEILETQFLSLCILGKDVPPAFEKAKVSSPLRFQRDETSEKEISKGVNQFMSELKFALNNGKVDLVVDTDGEERDSRNRKKISSAIDVLDNVAEEAESEENIAKIDDAITDLVDAETEMKREANIIPATEEAQKALQGMNDGKEGILSVDDLNYASNKKNSLLQPEEKEEDAPMADKVVKKKEEEEIKPQEVEKEVSEQPEQLKKAQEEDNKEVEDTEVVEEESVDEETPLSEEPTKDAVTEADAPTNEVQSPSSVGEAELTEGGEPVETGNQEETVDNIATGRETAASKRASAMLSELGDDEILQALTDRIAKTEEMKTRLTDLLVGQIGNEAPQAGDVQVQAEQTPIEEVGAQVDTEGTLDTVDTPTIGEEETVEVETEDKTEDTPVEGVEASDAEGDFAKEDETKKPEEEESTEEPESETKEDETKTEDDEEEKKKKTNFSADELSFADMLYKENLALKEENRKLLEFKLEVELSEKEDVLSQFDISDKAKEAIRLDFSKLTVEEVEEKAIVAEYKESKIGQKPTEEKISFSLMEEDSALPGKGEDNLETLKRFLGAIK